MQQLNVSFGGKVWVVTYSLEDKWIEIPLAFVGHVNGADKVVEEQLERSLRSPGKSYRIRVGEEAYKVSDSIGYHLIVEQRNIGGRPPIGGVPKVKDCFRY